jgi:hypothetical protein
MGWMPPSDGFEVCHAGDVALLATEEKASMEKATIIGIDLASESSTCMARRQRADQYRNLTPLQPNECRPCA